jgi:hypothetical protein
MYLITINKSVKTILIIALITLTGNFSYSKCSPEDIKVTSEKANQILNFINSKFKTQDVTGQVEYFQRTIKKCDLAMSNFNIDLVKLNEMKNAGLNFELENRKTVIDSDSRFRDVSLDLAQFKLIAEKFKLPQNEIQNFYSKYLIKGKESEVVEKKKCEVSIDLRNNVLGQVRDQKSLGWCYAFTAADLLSYKLGKKFQLLM